MYFSAKSWFFFKYKILLMLVCWMKLLKTWSAMESNQNALHCHAVFIVSSLQKNSQYRSIRCFLTPSLDTNQFQIIHNTVYPLLFRSSCFPFQSRSPRNIFFTILSSDILSTWPAHSSLLSLLLFGCLVLFIQPKIYNQSRFPDILIFYWVIYLS